MSDRPATGRRITRGFSRSRAGEATVPVASLSIWDPIFLGLDENGIAVYLTLPGRTILVGGEPGAGKSVLLNNIVAHAALSADVALWLIDGKLVELGPWKSIADVFVGNDPHHANEALAALQAEMDRRYEWLDSQRIRKVTRHHPVGMIVVVVDEIAYFSATVGDKTSREIFAVTLRDLVARGRAAGIMVVAATQRPSADIIVPSLRDIMAYRCAFRCTNDISSDIILGPGWVKEGYSAKSIPPEDQGVGFLLAEGGIPRRFKAAYLTDDDITTLVARAAWIRGAAHHTTGGAA